MVRIAITGIFPQFLSVRRFSLKARFMLFKNHTKYAAKEYQVLDHFGLFAITSIMSSGNPRECIMQSDHSMPSTSLSFVNNSAGFRSP